SAQQDEEIAMAGANVLTATKESGTANNSPGLFFDAKQVSASFSSAAPLLDEKDMAHASRRDNPGLIPNGKPVATIDLASTGGVTLVKGEWRYSDTKIVEADFRGPGPDKQPTGAPVKTYDYTPHAGAADFNDSKWDVISPTTLDQR